MVMMVVILQVSTWLLKARKKRRIRDVFLLKISALLICHNLTFHLLLKTGLCLSLLVIIIQNGSDLFSRVFNQIVSGAMDSAMVLKSEDSGCALYPTGQKQSLELKFAKFTR